MKKWIGRSIQLLIAIILCLSISISQTRRPAAKSKSVPRAPFLLQSKSYEETPYVTRVIFKNGMTVLVQEVRSLPFLSIQAYVSRGESLQIAQDPQLADMLASIVSRGGMHGSTGTYRQKIQLLGGVLSHSDDLRNTKYEIVVPSAQWKQALALQEEMLFHPSFDADAIRMETHLAGEEIRGILDDPIEYSREKLIELGFDKTQAVKYKISSEDSLKTITPEKLAVLHKSTYIPAGITLVVCGDVRSSDILNEICLLIDQRIEPQTKANLEQKVFQQKGFQYRALLGDIPTPRILFGYHTVAEKGEDFRALEVLNAILGKGEGAVLPERVKNQKHLAYSAESVLASYPNYGYLSIEMTTDPQNIDKSEIAALTEIELLKRNEPNDFEMERAFAQLEHTYWKKAETVSGKAETLARFEFLGEWKRKDKYIEELRKVKAADVTKVARRYLQLQNCSLLEYLPVTMGERMAASENVLKTFEGLLGPSADQEQEARNKEVVYSIDMPAEKGQFQYSEIQYPFQKASILRGPDMYIREDHTAPLIDLGILFPGGKQYENGANSGITELMMHLMLQGDGQHHGSQFLSQLEVYGGKIQPVITDDYFGFYFSIMSDNFEPAFNLLQAAIKNPVFSKQEVDRQKELQLNRILQRNASSQYLRKQVEQVLFKEFSYALDAAGTEASISGITPESLQNWHNGTVRNKKPIVIAIGDAKGTSLASNFVQHFSGSRMQNADTMKDFAKPLAKGYSFEKNRYSSESMIFIGFQAPPIEDEDWEIATVLQAYLGGQGRFAQEIRDRQGIANQVSMIYEPRLRGGSIIASSSLNPKNEDAVLKQFTEEIIKVSDSPIDPHDFRAALNSAIGSHGIRNQNRENQILDFTSNLLAGRGIPEYQNFANDIFEVTVEDLKAVAKKILNMDKSVILRVHANAR
jgi:zinc protease